MDGERRLGKFRIGESAYGNCDPVRLSLEAVADRGTAVGAKAMGDLRAGVGDANVLLEFALDRHRPVRKPRLRPEHAPRSALARDTVAHRYPQGLTNNRDVRVATTT